MATLILEHSDRSGAGRLGTTLRDHGHRLDIRRLHRGDAVPADLDDVDAVITCGGPQSPVDDAIEWMAAELDLLRAAHESGRPVLGICLGSQLLARALGGAVTAIDGGPSLGWGEVRLTPPGREDPLYAGVAWTSLQMQWHTYHVSETPSGARVLATSERTPVQAWSVGLSTYGVQYHFEAGRRELAMWADDEPDALAKVGLTRADLDAQTDANVDAFARLGERLANRIALVLMPVDRRYAGIAKDLHH